MATAPASAPPPYTAANHTTTSDVSHGTTLQKRISTSTEGIRASIRDNAPVLWMLGHGGTKPLPQDFFIATTTSSPNPLRAISAEGGIRACIMFSELVYKARQEARMFVQGTVEETMEEALASLLLQTQVMIERRWLLEPQHSRMVKAPCQLV